MPSRHSARLIVNPSSKPPFLPAKRTRASREGGRPPSLPFPRFCRKSLFQTHYKLHDFCVNRSVCTRLSLTRYFSSSSFLSASQVGVSSVTDEPATMDRSAKPPVALAGASEVEWLREDGRDGALSSIGVPDPPQPRVDWRLRASSRLKKPETRSDEEKPRYPRRTRLGDLSPDRDGPYYHSYEAYRSKFLYLLHREEEEESAALKHRLSTWTIPSLEREGYCHTELSAYWLHQHHFGNPIASFSIGPGVLIPDSKLEKGCQVLLSRLDPLKETPETGSIIERTGTALRVCFPSKFDIVGLWRLDMGLPNLMFDRMRSAISHLANDLDEIEKASDRWQQYILQGTELRDVLLKSFQPLQAIHGPDEEAGPELPEPVEKGGISTKFADFYLPWEEMGAFKHDQRIVSWVKRNLKPDDSIILEGDPPLGLNASQRQAVATMIGRRISLIQGPPGTGKTKTIIETVKLLKVYFEVPHPILVGTFTNVAVDNLVEGLANAGVKPLRVGSTGNIRQSLLSHSLEHKLQDHPLHSVYDKVVCESASLSVEITTLTGRYAKAVNKLHEQNEPTKQRQTRVQNMLVDLEMKKQRLKRLERKIFAVRQEMLRGVVADADVICTTCLTTACSALNIVDFPVVFLDEASMSSEPASLIPIMKGCQHLALIGDHKQLPPVIISREAKEGGLNVSLFERLTEEGHVHSVMLNTQYRMHPDISEFPALEFYDSKLEDGTIDGVGDALPGLEAPISTHLNVDNRLSVVFVDHGGNESMKGRSRINVTEAHLVASVVEDLLLVNKDLQGRDIGIIAPYAAQISLLERFLNTDPQYQERFNAVLGVQRAMQMEHVEIKTVDGFEGREKDVIIFSTVRNNEHGNIGFLADKKRLNVGLTRAKRGLFVLGSIATLKAGQEGGAYDGTRLVNVREGYIQHGGSGDESGKQDSSTTKKKRRGRESWQRYMQFVLKKKWVVYLHGHKLGQALYGHWDPLRDKLEEDAMAEVRHAASGYSAHQRRAVRA